MVPVDLEIITRPERRQTDKRQCLAMNPAFMTRKLLPPLAEGLRPLFLRPLCFFPPLPA